MRRRAFTILEMMLAIGIFAIGMAAVAAIFPAAAMMQRQTMTAITSDTVASNADAMLATEPLPESGIESLAGSNWDTDFLLHPIQDTSTTLAGETWTLSDRAYPSGNLIPDSEARDYYWIPLAQNINVNIGLKDWDLHLAILKNRSSEDDYDTGPAGPKGGPYTSPVQDCANPHDPTAVPGLFKVALSSDPVLNVQPATFEFDNTPRLVVAGDLVLDEYGTPYKVLAVTDRGITVDVPVSGHPTDATPPGHLWVGGAADAGRPSPLKRVVVLGKHTTP